MTCFVALIRNPHAPVKGDKHLPPFSPDFPDAAFPHHLFHLT
jgi:hypothetical protein